MLVGKEHKKVEVVVPVDALFLTTPGLLGCPVRPVHRGDDHFRLSTSPKPVVVEGEERLTWTLTKLPSGAPDRRRQEVRRGSHLVAHARRCGTKFRGVVDGFITIDGIKRPVPKKKPHLSGLRNNPSAAVAEALADVLPTTPKLADLMVWTNDSLVVATLKDPKAPVSVRVPEIAAALERLRGAVEPRRGSVSVRRAAKGKAVTKEVIDAAACARVRRAEDVVAQLRRQPTPAA